LRSFCKQGKKHSVLIRDAELLKQLSRSKTVNSVCSPASRKRRQKGNPVPGGYNWATLFLGDINTGTWPSRLGES
jgi:hypothetical protein